MNAGPVFARALLDPNLPCPDGLRAWNSSDPARRFAVYRNNVVTSLIDALADTFPVTQQLVGEEFFRAMAGIFVRAAPPKCAWLTFYGDGFPLFVERFEPARCVPYLADVARLELLRIRAFHAADADPLSPDAIACALAEPERVPELRVRCHPSLGLLDSRYAVVSLWATHQGAGDLSRVDPGIPEAALVARCGLNVCVTALPPSGYRLVSALTGGLSFGEAAALAAADDAGFDLTPQLALLLRSGVLCSLHPPQETAS